MRIKFNRVRFDRQTSNLILSSDDIEQLLIWARTMDVNVEYDIEVKVAKAKRSLDANGYAWALIRELAEVLGLKPVEVYKQMILDMYTYTVECIKEEDYERNKIEWEKGHVGRAYIKIGDSKEQKGWIFVKKFRGSSDYDTREMSKFLDAIIFECYQQGIETKTPDEINKLKEAWV